jgi:hypothetical protein
MMSVDRMHDMMRADRMHDMMSVDRMHDMMSVDRMHDQEGAVRWLYERLHDNNFRDDTYAAT